MMMIINWWRKKVGSPVPPATSCSRKPGRKCEITPTIGHCVQACHPVNKRSKPRSSKEIVLHAWQHCGWLHYICHLPVYLNCVGLKAYRILVKAVCGQGRGIWLPEVTKKYSLGQLTLSVGLFHLITPWPPRQWQEWWVGKLGELFAEEKFMQTPVLQEQNQKSRWFG